MSCKSPSVERVVKKSKRAKTAIEELNKQLSELEARENEKFHAKIEEHAKRAKINDFRRIVFNSAIKTEYSHEFSIDKIAAVVAKTLDTVTQSLQGSVMTVLTSNRAVSSYSDLVVSISEAARSASSLSNSMTFSANRIAPGIFVFLSANSLSIKDEATFGEEAVTSTSIIYCLQTSTQDVKHSAKFKAAYTDAKLLINLKNIQMGYTEDLAKGEITIAVWNEKDSSIQERINKIEKRIDSDSSNDVIAPVAKGMLEDQVFSLNESRKVLEDSVIQFENRGSLYKPALVRTKELLNKPMVSNSLA